MLADQGSNTNLTKIQITQIPLYHQIQILNSLRNNLFEFSRDFQTQKITLKEDININFENYISQELSVFLNNKANQTGYLFGFQATGPDIFVRQFGSRVHGLTLFLIEAKRLPSTSYQDYVNTGIKRFKKEEHGRQHNTAAMLGYVQEENFSYWHEKMNDWIDVLINSEKSESSIVWEEKDKLSEIAISEIGEYKSVHKRETIQTITLHHFWVSLC